MALNDHSFRHLLPDFRISPGTQVVLKVDKPQPDGSIRQRGSVALVVASPDHNRQPYRVRFADGREIEVFFPELALRRKEVEDELVRTDLDLLPYVVYRCRVDAGSPDERRDDMRAEVGRMRGGQAAAPAADRGAHRVDDVSP